MDGLQFFAVRRRAGEQDLAVFNYSRQAAGGGDLVQERRNRVARQNRP